MPVNQILQMFLGMMLVSLPASAGQPFGPNGGKGSDCGTADFHFGIDRAAATGSPVTAVAHGIVVKVEDDDNALNDGGGHCGRYVVIRHNYPNGRVVFTRYARLGRIVGDNARRIAAGLIVQRNEKIGEVGGFREFHFEVRPVDQYIVERFGPHTIDDPSMNWLNVHPVDPRKFDFEAFAAPGRNE
ncbi:MAG TPA: M23 family metallopeptidase [Rhodospirillaceae bacterium]|nr:M23 family metallopeptidase [Rhodospirillaceae bacterium]